MGQINNSKVIKLKKKDIKKLENNSIIITHNNFKNKNGLLFVHADWCGFCKITKPEIIKLAEITNNEFPIGELEDIHKDVIKMLNIKGFPTIFIIKNGIINEEYNDKRQTKSIINNICNINDYKFCNNK